VNSRERWDDLGAGIRAGVERGLSNTWTALPVKVVEDTKDGHVVKLQPTIKGKKTDRTGKKTDVEMPILGECPIQYSSGGGFTITHPVSKDDEGIVVFSSRCIDNWWDKGGVQPQGFERRHNLSDGMYIPGIRSKPRKLGGDDKGNGAAQPAEAPWLADGATTMTVDLRSDQPKTKKVSLDTLQIRTDSGDYYIELTKDSVNIKCKTCTIEAEDKVHIQTKLVEIKATDSVAIDSPKVTISGELQVGGDIKGAKDVQAQAGAPGAKVSWAPLTAREIEADYARIAADPRLGVSDVVPGLLTVSQQFLPPGVSGIASQALNMVAGDNFTIDGAIALGQNAIGQFIPGGSQLVNAAHTVYSVLSTGDFTALLPALPGQIQQVIGNPTVQAIIHLISHDHHGVRAGLDISQKPVTGT
jgi:hypothetical protein